MRDGEVFVVNGQKVWSTSAHHADLGMLLARTDWDAPKHKGISWMVLPMHQQGVETRPLRQMNGYASFNEVFLSDAEVPVDNVVGQLGEGWPIVLHDARTRARIWLGATECLRVERKGHRGGRGRGRGLLCDVSLVSTTGGKGRPHL